MDSVHIGGSVRGDTGVVVRCGECGSAGDFPEPGEFSDYEFGIFGVERCRAVHNMEERFLDCAGRRFRRSESGGKSRPASLGMTVGWVAD